MLERDSLGIREVRLFNAVVRWSEAECQRQQWQLIPENKRKALGKALSLIRFPLMTIEEFAAGIWGQFLKSGVLNRQRSGGVNDFMPVRAFMYLKIFLLLLRFDSDSLSLPATYSQNKIKIKNNNGSLGNRAGLYVLLTHTKIFLFASNRACLHFALEGKWRSDSCNPTTNTCLHVYPQLPR